MYTEHRDLFHKVMNVSLDQCEDDDLVNFLDYIFHQKNNLTFLNAGTLTNLTEPFTVH